MTFLSSEKWCFSTCFIVKIVVLFWKKNFQLFFFSADLKKHKLIKKWQIKLSIYIYTLFFYWLERKLECFFTLKYDLEKKVNIWAFFMWLSKCVFWIVNFLVLEQQKFLSHDSWSYLVSINKKFRYKIENNELKKSECEPSMGIT